MSKDKILVNSTTSIVQMFLSAFLIFFQYKFLYNTLGVSNLGIWSLVISVNIFFGVSGFGMQGSIIKFVSKYYSQKNFTKAADVIQTALISMIVFSIIGVLIAYPVTVYALKFFMDPSSCAISYQILPIAFMSFVISMIGSVTASSLDGINKIYVRNVIMFLVSVLIFIEILLITPRWGLYGLTCIKLSESILFLVSTMLLVKRDLKELPIVPRRWDREIFREILGYSLKFQVINFSVIFSEPLVKFFLSKFGGVAYVGIYELANKFVTQTRSFIVAAYQSLVPAVASYQEREPEKIMSFYLSAYKILLFISIPVYTVLIIASPIVSFVWIGEINTRFIFLFTILSFGWFANTIAVSAYFTNMGTGDINANVVSHILVGLIDLTGGLILGYFFRGKGVAIAIAIAITIGGFYQLVTFHRKNKLKADIFPLDTRMLFFMCVLLVFTFIGISLQKIHDPNFIVYDSALLCCSMVVIILLIVKNRIFKNVVSGLMSRVAKLKLKRGEAV